MTTQKHNRLLPLGKTTLLSDKLKCLDGKMHHLKLEKSRLLKLEKSDALSSLKKFATKAT